jgi:hypothetical protein
MLTVVKGCGLEGIDLGRVFFTASRRPRHSSQFRIQRDGIKLPESEADLHLMPRSEIIGHTGTLTVYNPWVI